MGESMVVVADKKGGIKLGSLAEVMQLAELLVKTEGFVPDHFKKDKFKRDKPKEQSINEVTAVILKGLELGLGPMGSLQGIYIFKGKTGIYYDVIVGLLRREGYGVRWDKTDEFIAKVVLTHPDGTSFPYSFTIEQAKKAGLVKKAKDGSETTVWYTHRATMLRARAVTTAARSFAGGVMAGIYEHDEILEIERKEKVITVFEVDENMSGTDRLLKTIEATNQEPPEEAPELCAPEEEVIQFNQDVRSEVFIELNARIKGAKDQRELAMCVGKITSNQTLSEQEKDELRGTFSDKKQSLG